MAKQGLFVGGACAVGDASFVLLRNVYSRDSTNPGPLHTAKRYIALCGAVSSLLCLRSTDLLFAIPAQQIKSLPLGEMFALIVPLYTYG